MTSIELDMIQTAGVGALALVVGMILTRRVAFLQRFCIPSPVSGGIIFSLITLALYGWCNIEVSFYGTLKDVCMLAFFTSVGFQSDLKVLKQGGKALVVMLILLVLIISLQNLMPWGITRLMKVDPLIGIAAGSISMTGGHGTAGGFASVLEQMGLQGAGTIGMAAATFGLIAGSMIGGPMAEYLIRKKLTHEQMQPPTEEIDPAMAGIESDEASPAGRAKRVSSNEQEFQQYAKASYCILLAMAGGAFHIPAPKVRAIRLVGELRPGVSAKDVILKVLEKFGTKGNVGWIFEYTGPGVATLDVPSRATITNMGAELGVTTSVFPSDAVTRQFLAAQGREADWTEIAADDGAAYDDVFEVDLGALEPLAAAPHSPGNVVTVKSFAGTRVNQIMIGSCTNSSYRDIRTVAQILEGRHVADDVEVGIACGSRQVVNMLAADGSLATLIKAGCRILENACGFCIGAHMSPATGAVSLRTNNRNFEGRSGTKSAQVYLVSPETAAASALTGVVTACESVEPVMAPEKFPIDDAMFLYRDTAGKGVPGTPIVRGPNIATVPRGEPLPDALHACAAIKVGDKITTDHIMPAGARLKFRSNVPEYSKYVFEPCDPTFQARCLANKANGAANVIIAGESYGQGSSREHAALCPMYLGVKAVIAKSIERIHRANLINFGIVPFTFEDPADYDKVSQGDGLSFTGLRAAIEGDGRLSIATPNARIRVRTTLSEREKHLVLCGGLLASL